MKKTTTYRQSKQESLFEKKFTLKALSAMGNPLEQVSALVDFEFFRPTLEKTLLTEDCKTSAGRRPIDVVLMFKVIFLQRYYVLGDHQIEYQIIDRTSFREFLNIHTVSDVHDEKTVWACKNKLVKANVMRPVICEKGHRNHPLTKKQKKRNRKKSKRRCRVEHVFGFIEGVMHGSFVRTIGIARAKASFALTCLVYNIFRYCQINKSQPQLLSCKG